MNLENRKKIHLLWGSSLLGVLSVFLYALITKIRSNCFHATDFSIYQEAIYKIAHFGDLNPFVNVRNIKIFNDHFDPIVLLAGIYTKIFGYHAESLLIFEYLWFLGIFFCISRMHKLSLNQKLFFATLVLFTKGILSGLNFPIHPTTWSLLPCFLLPLVLKRNKDTEVIALGLALCLFKESFPFGTLMLGIYFSLHKELKKAIPLLLIAISFLVFNFYFRSKVLGPTIGYGAGILKPIFLDPLNAIPAIFIKLDLKSFFKVYYPFIIPIFLICKSFKTIPDFLKSRVTGGTLFFIIPLLAIQVLANQIHFQYGAQLTAPLLGLIVLYPSLYFQKKWLPYLIALLFVGSGIGSITKNFRSAFNPKQRFCIISDEKDVATKEMHKLVDSFPKESEILATGGVVPMIMHPERTIFQAGYFSEKKPQYDYLILERNGSGKTFPLTQSFIEDIIPQCRKEGAEVILDNKFYFISKGSSTNCFKPILDKWIAH